MKNKRIIAILITAVLALSACKSETIPNTDEIAQYITENQLNVDEAGNYYDYTVGRDLEKNKIVVSTELLSIEAKKALEDEFGDLVEVVELNEEIVPNGFENYVENEPTEEQIAKLRKELGLESSEPSFFDNPLFHGDFGHSIDLRFLVTVVLLFFVGIFGVIYFMKKRKRK